ncbi:ABC transporter ATP-binding protein [Caproicibacter sp.]|uniref:ABC transporter ATP-binding protein n=1 Tax=Caproicibacter sp. TaxID=2814884 RepID=UPI003988F8DC
MRIEIRNASKSYHGAAVLNNFSLSLPQTGTVCLFGPSGCGKTTILNCIAGLEFLDSGRILGTENLKISYLFQEDRLLPWNTAQKNIEAVLPRENSRALATEWLRLVGLEGAADKYPCQLSGGMRRRVAIARALAYGGELLLLDEPFQRLDAGSKGRMMELIEKKAEGKLKILVTHDKKAADRLSDIVYHFDGKTSEILDNINGERQQ